MEKSKLNINHMDFICTFIHKEFNHLKTFVFSRYLFIFFDNFKLYICYKKKKTILFQFYEKYDVL